MVNSGMIDHGYTYVNIDDCWSARPGSKDSSLLVEPRDKNGMINSNNRFPDMKAMTDYIHLKGLKAGIYTSPGKLTCAGHTAIYGYEEQGIKRFADWGFDFLKYDWCSYSDIGNRDSLADLQKPYRQISKIISKQKRDIVLNLCQYGMGQVWKWGKAVGGQSWRTADDLGGSFQGIATALFRDGFDVYSRDSLHLYAGPGGWNDPDYLLIGYLSNWKGQTVPTPLTPNEQYTQVSLWSIVAAPLILSGDISRLDDFTLSLLTNDEIIDVDQDPLGKPGYRVSKNGNTEVWIRQLEDGSHAVGLFNRGESETDVSAFWKDLGISGKQSVRDLWRQKDLGDFTQKFGTQVPRHGVVMLRLSPLDAK
jgi:alpha-galactosidase